MEDDSSVDANDDEKIEPTRESAIQRFMRLLSEMMLEGRTREHLLSWAMSLGVPEPTFADAYKAVKLSWKTAGATYADLCDQRDINRARLLLIYRKAMKQSNLMAALKAVEKMIDLDGLEQPIQINHTLGTVGTQGSITNLAREQVATLVEKMRVLAAKRAGAADPLLSAAMDEVDRKIAGANGSNGHKTNGHNGHSIDGDPRNAGVIDVGEPDDDGDVS